MEAESHLVSEVAETSPKPLWAAIKVRYRLENLGAEELVMSCSMVAVYFLGYWPKLHL